LIVSGHISLRRKRFRIVLALLLFGPLIACSGHPAIPADGRAADIRDSSTDARPSIEEKSLPRRQPDSPRRVVVHGDTLYSIAWESGLDYQELAKWNRISSPYQIRPGQVLQVFPPTETVEAPARQVVTSRPQTKTTSKSTTASSKTEKQFATTEKTETKKTTPSRSSSRKSDTRIGSWEWPADGPLVKRYSDRGTGKGIDIGGKRGQPIRATAGGRIVYQGSGLRGYGQLIIIKHSDEYLSAYAHNDRIHVKEGDVVKRGQKIADMGNTGTDRVKLHFEIRRQGVPTDPLKYLPKR
jgi:lipoprotein NlpD